jgi:hypothetical protein
MSGRWLLGVSLPAVLAGLLLVPPLGRADPALPERPADADRPVLVRDVGPDEAPRSFRTSDQIRASLGPGGNAAGLDRLRASGSGTPSTAGLAWIARRTGRPLVVVDLRQESHGLLDGAAVTWTATRNWANLGKTREAALRDEADRLVALARLREVRLPQADDFKRDPKAPGPLVGVSRVSSEQALVEQAGARYCRLTVPDHLRPSDADVDRFVALIRALPPGAWLHVHCRAGHGRTTTFLVLYDMLRNADRVSAAAIVARQAAVPPRYDLLDAARNDGGESYRERARFVRTFHAYARAFLGGYKGSWSEWQREQHGGK